MHGNAKLTPAGREVARPTHRVGTPGRPCRRGDGGSRQTAYRWWRRFLAEGRAGLIDRSSRPQCNPRQTPRALEQRIQRLRRQLKLGPVRTLLEEWAYVRVYRSEQARISTLARSGCISTIIIAVTLRLARLPPADRVTNLPGQYSQISGCLACCETARHLATRRCVTGGVPVATRPQFFSVRLAAAFVVPSSMWPWRVMDPRQRGALRQHARARRSENGDTLSRRQVTQRALVS